MTIASGPARPHLDFAVQHTDSEFKRAFFALTRGTTVEITAPRGHFLLERARPALMIASGIGVTPFRSMLGIIESTQRSRGARHAHDGSRRCTFMTRPRRARARGCAAREWTVDDGQLRNLAAEIATPVWYVAGPVEDVQHVSDLLGSSASIRRI